jgi:hypothetical protein
MQMVNAQLLQIFVTRLFRLLTLALFYFISLFPLKNMITLENYLMGRDVKYPKEFTPEIKASAEVLLIHVNDLLSTLNFQKTTRVTSGWRPYSVNKAQPKAAKNSLHVKALAIDLHESSGELIKLLMTEGILEEFNLYMEDPKDAKDHIHLQVVPPKSLKRIFRA